MRLCLILFAALFAVRASALELDPLLQKSNLWSLKSDDFKAQPEAAAYVWTSSAHDSARAGERDLSFQKLPVIESVARFDDGKLSQITLDLYSRGDAGEIEQDAFKALLQKVIDSLNKATNATFTPQGKDEKSAVHAEGLLWQTPVSRYLLEYSFTKEVKSRNIPFRAEFIRLIVSPPQHASSLLASIPSPSQPRFNASSHVKRVSTNGDVYITDVPMVDQGQKGYCAVACAERVLRYYGNAVDENEMAQVANTATSGGTSAEAMFQALKKLEGRLHIRVHSVEQFDTKQIISLINNYNRAAKHEGVEQLPDPSRVIDMDAMFLAMNPDVLSEVRLKNPSELTRFEQSVETAVNNGAPLIWSVYLGLFPEAGIPQAHGGHMRLIVGYNNKTNEIIYSDSWAPAMNLSECR